MTKNTGENEIKKRKNSRFKKAIRNYLKKHYNESDPQKTKSNVYKRAEGKKTKIVLILTILAIILVMMFTPVFNIKDITVTGNVRVDTETALKVSGIVEGSNIFRINKIKANSRLEKIPFIDNVKIKRHLPSKVEIIIEENKECAFIKFMGNYIGIDMNGKILEVLQTDEKVNLPVITGITLKSFEAGKISDFTEEDKMNAIFELIGYLNNNEIYDLVKAINIKKDESLQLTLKNNTIVELGYNEKLKYKTAYLKSIIAELGEFQGGVIELADTNNVSYRGSSK